MDNPTPPRSLALRIVQFAVGVLAVAAGLALMFPMLNAPKNSYGGVSGFLLGILGGIVGIVGIVLCSRARGGGPKV